MTLLPRSIPHECTGSCCHQCRAKMRRRILRQISSGFGMTAASMPAKPTLFPIASTFGVTRARPVRYSLQPATIWYEVRRWPTTIVRTCSCASGTANWDRAVNATCAWIWQFSLGDICCTNKMHHQLVPSCNAGKGG